LPDFCDDMRGAPAAAKESAARAANAKTECQAFVFTSFRLMF
jgi:hypothetical protein